MLIGVDIDGVLFPWSEVANEVLMARFGIADPGPHRSWDHLGQSVPMTVYSWLWSNGGNAAVFGQVGRTYPEAVAAINALMRYGHEVHFVTHRDPRKAAVFTAAFLQLHFGDNAWGGVHVVRNSTRKARLARWDAFIDDRVETVYDLLGEERIRVFAPQRPWNQELSDELHLTYYSDPFEIVEALNV